MNIYEVKYGNKTLTIIDYLEVTINHVNKHVLAETGEDIEDHLYELVEEDEHLIKNILRRREKAYAKSPDAGREYDLREFDLDCEEVCDIISDKLWQEAKDYIKYVKEGN